MAWPSPQEYHEAVQNPATAFDDSELRGCTIESDAMGLPKARSGNFAVVYKAISTTGKVWAVRCFNREVNGQRERYHAIASELTRHAFPFTVGFTYHHTGIRVLGQRYPLLKMEWVQGEGLIAYIKRTLSEGKAERLASLADALTSSVQTLSTHNIAHGDLQHDNILVVNDRPVFIDYDGMFVPSLAGRPGTEIGHSNYQHPQRTLQHYGPGVDNVALWVIALSLKALAEEPELWKKHEGGEECLLFRKSDLARPDTSKVLKDIEASRKPLVRIYAGWFRQVLSLGPLDAPLFGRPLTGVRVKPPQSVAPTPHATLTPPAARTATDTLVGQWLTLPSTPKLQPSTPDKWWIDHGASTASGEVEGEFDTFAPSPPIELPPLPPLPKKDELVLEFDFAPDVEHAYLMVTVFGALTLMILSFAAVFHWAVGVTLCLLLAGGCLRVFWSRYREAREEAIQSIRTAERELSELLTETESFRDVFKSAADELKRERARALSSLSKRLEVTQSTLATDTAVLKNQKEEAAAAIASRREAARLQFDDELRDVRASMQKKIAMLDDQLSEIDVELSPSALARDHESDVVKELQKHAIATAKEDYFGPVLKDLLIAHGVTTAAEITPAIKTIPAIGPQRGSLAVSWKRAVEEQIRKTLAHQSPSSNGKKGKLEQKREEIKAERRASEAELAALEADVESRRGAELGRLQQEALAQDAAFEAETESIKSKCEGITQRVRRRIAELENVPELALWSTRQSSLEKRTRRIEKLLSHVRDQLVDTRSRLTFWQYLRSL